MKFFKSLGGIFCLVLFFAAGVFAGDEVTWRPVSPEELQMKAPRVDPDADAEAIFWDTRLDDKKTEKIIYEHYVRIKIFTERGRDKYKKFEIPFAKGKKVEDIAARVIRPDGSIVNLNPSDIFERETVKAGKIKIMAKTFAVPGIEPGVIFEYRYKEVYSGAWGNGLKLYFQSTIPLQSITYHIRPQKGFILRYNYYNMSETRFVEDPSDKGFYIATMTNIPAYKDEPNMPPEDEVRRWTYMTYGTQSLSSSPWDRLNNRYFSWIARNAKPTELINKKAAEITDGATTDDEKLRRIYNFAQKNIKNITFDKKLTDEEREKLEDDYDHAEDALTTGIANSIYIHLLFASLAKASGYDTGLVFSGDRSEYFFHPDKYPFTSFLHLSCVSVRVEGVWKFFDASVPYVPYGYLAWNEEGVNSMLITEKGYGWQMTPVSDQSRSPAKRTAKLKLLEDGTLEGTVRIEYLGQQAISRRRNNFQATVAEREESVKEEIKNRASSAEITEAVMENLEDNTKPLVYSYKVRIANYAQKTGKRLIFQPGYFEYGISPLFPMTARTNNIYFSYPWSEQDDIEISLPENFAPDTPDAPAEVFDGGKTGYLKIGIGMAKTENKLFYTRKFYFGSGKSLLFPANLYPVIKDLFDLFHKADSHLITLKQK